MPPILQQMRIRDGFTSDFTLARAWLKPGRKYADAVNLFAPYQSVQEPLRNLLIRAKQRSEPAYIFVNSRFEDNAPGTIEAVVGSF